MFNSAIFLFASSRFDSRLRFSLSSFSVSNKCFYLDRFIYFFNDNRIRYNYLIRILLAYENVVRRWFSHSRLLTAPTRPTFPWVNALFSPFPHSPRPNASPIQLLPSWLIRTIRPMSPFVCEHPLPLINFINLSKTFIFHVWKNKILPTCLNNWTCDSLSLL